MTADKIPIELKSIIDNTAAFSSHEINEWRDANLEFEYIDNRRNNAYFSVHAWGDKIFHPSRLHRGKLKLTKKDLDGMVEQCRRVWQKQAIDYTVPYGEGRRHPFSDNWDLSSEDPEHFKNVILKLAGAGKDLFDFIYNNGDVELKKILDTLVSAMHQQIRILTFHSNDCFVPWRMLYTPLDPSSDPFAEYPSFTMDGFWGYRHIIEQQFKESEFESLIESKDGKIYIGLNVDSRLDEEFYNTPCIKPILDFFQTIPNAVKTKREDKHTLRRALTSPDFHDAIFYFGCHGFVEGSGRYASSEQPNLRLRDDEAITTADFQNWLAGNRLKCNPIVFINACEGGRMESKFYSSFGPTFLSKGANCVIGAQTDIPASFSAEFAQRLLQTFFRGKQHLGRILNLVTRDLADNHKNPLGLIYSLYHGLDTRLKEPILS